MIARSDRDVGRLLPAERDLDDNALIVFTFDNGPHREGGNDPDFKDRSLPELLEKPDQQPSKVARRRTRMSVVLWLRPPRLIDTLPTRGFRAIMRDPFWPHELSKITETDQKRHGRKTYADRDYL
jgi:arylsulfatase A-like enzyme